MTSSITRFWLGCLLMVLTPLLAETTNRTALVVGNSGYEAAAGSLRNTDDDARAIARALRKLGFKVMERHDLTRDQFLHAVEEFRKTLPGAEVALFYYAGHGISVAGSNYLIPLKSGYSGETSDASTLRMLAETRLFNAEQIVADMSAAGTQCNIVILDACRNTPLARTARTRDISTSGGLSEMNPPAGSLIAFATDAGRTASDGVGSNGLYTEELLKYMLTPGLTIEQVFKKTRAGVLTKSQGQQVPAEYSRLVGDDIYLAGPTSVSAPAPAPETGQETIIPPKSVDLVRLALNGKSKDALRGLQQKAKAEGPGAFAIAPLEAVLERVKADLKLPSPDAETAAETCSAVLRVLPECLSLEHPQASSLAAKAYNRRGDALLLLGKNEAALEEFDRAVPLAPSDAYILYNRGRAHLALGQKDEAWVDFTAAMNMKPAQPGARKLAEDALKARENPE